MNHPTAADAPQLTRQEVEQLALEAVREVLGAVDASLDDDFFALGGQSLDAGKVIARLSRNTGVRASLADFFEEPTARQLAALIVSAVREGSDAR